MGRKTMMSRLSRTVQAALGRIQSGEGVTLGIEIPREGDALVFLSDGVSAREFQGHVRKVAMNERFEEMRHPELNSDGVGGRIFQQTRSSYPSTFRKDVETLDVQEWEDRSPYEMMESMLTTPEKPAAVYVEKDVLHLNLNVANGSAPGSGRVRREIAEEYIEGLNGTIEEMPDENVVWMSKDDVNRLVDADSDQ